MNYVRISDFGWRLGNQMFQLATAYDYCYKNDACLVLNKSLKFPIKDDSDVLILHAENNNLPEKCLSVKITQTGFDYRELHSISFIKETLNKRNIDDSNLCIALHGYFQSYKYFEEKRTQKFFNLDSVIESAKLSKASNHKSCSVHIRRGDYLNHPDHHPVLDIEYYREAMHKIGKDYDFYVCSDDLKYATTEFYEALRNDFHMIHCRYSELEDLALMSTCRHNIIANSSFSWWSAYLNKNPSKVVIAPNANQRWFGKALKHYNMNDLLPPEWIQI